MNGMIYIVSPRGYSFVAGEDKVFYFLHRCNIKQGEDLVAVGALVTFDTLPPMPAKKYPMAVNAVVRAATSNEGSARS